MRDKKGRFMKGHRISEEERNRQRDSIRGEKNHFFGKNHTEESRKKMGKIGRNAWNKGKNTSLEVRKKMSISLRGENHPNWKGGISSLYYKIRSCFQYRQWRSDVFTRDNFFCQLCGYNKGGILEAHHIKRFIDIISEYKIKSLDDAINCEELWNINNGITLCKECHRKIVH